MPALENKSPETRTQNGGDDPPDVEDDEEGDEDYMSMNFAEPGKTVVETSIQRRARKQREAEAKSRPISKDEQAAQDTAKRDEALATSLDASNKGFKMMAKFGFKGGALGKKGAEGRVEPIQISVKEDRGGVGLESEKKRKFREDAEGMEKRVKAEEVGYRERVRMAREEKRVEAQIEGAMKVAERLDAEGEGSQVKSHDGNPTEMSDKPVARTLEKPLHSIPLVWRSIVKHRRMMERERRMRYDLQQSLSRLPTYEDPDEDIDYKRAMGKEEEELEEDDPELDDFNSLRPEERLTHILKYMRKEHWYCFWCKTKYREDTLSGCPGLTEEAHD